jgi:FkbM family methyltransferase
VQPLANRERMIPRAQPRRGRRALIDDDWPTNYGGHMFVKAARAILQSAYQFRGLREMPAPLTTSARLAIGSVLRLNLLPDRSLPNPIRLLDYSVTYAGMPQLRDLFQEIFVRGTYMFHTTQARPLIVDCGSNIGMSILFFKRLYPGSIIIGFEPDPATFAILQQNIRQNGLPDVTVHNCALTDHDGTIAFYQSKVRDSSLQMSILRERSDGARTDVPARRLSTFLPADVDLLKVDIEGAETTVLRELAAANALARVRQLHLEYHHHIRPEVDDFSVTLELLERQGFGYQLQASSPDWPRPRQTQYVAIHAYRKSS